MSRNFVIVLLILSIFIVGNIHAQNSKIDSLENVLKHYQAEDTVKVNFLIEIGKAVSTSDSKKMLSVANQALELSESLKYLKGQSESLFLMGLYYRNSDKSKAIDYAQNALNIAEGIKYRTGVIKILNLIGGIYGSLSKKDLALETYQKALVISEQINDKLGIANCYSNISIEYIRDANYPKAIEYLQKSKEIYEVVGNKKGISSNLNSLGIIYERQGNSTLSLDCYQKALRISDELNDKSAISSCLINIGNIYEEQNENQQAIESYTKALKINENLGDKGKISSCYLNIGTIYKKIDNPKALEYFEIALKYAEDVSSKLIIPNILLAMGDYYLEHNDYQKSLEIYQKALSIANEIAHKRYLCRIKYAMGRVYLKQKNYAKALSISLQSLEIADELKLLGVQKDLHYQLSEIYAAINNYKYAYEQHKIYKNLNDSIFNKDNVKKMVGLEYTYKFEKEKQAIKLEQQKKDAIQLAEKKKQSVIILALFGGFALMFLLALIAFRSYQLKHKTNLILTEQKREILEKNEELVQLNEEILVQRDEISVQKTEIEMKNRKLQELNDTKDKFFGIIAHDLKNPFNSILGFSNFLATSGCDSTQENMMECVGMIHSSAQSAYKLLENLLEWSRSQIGSIDYIPQNLVFKDIVFETIYLCENLAKAKNITINYEISDNMAVYADYNMLKTILRNLLTNAIKFTHKGGSVIITSTEKNGKNEITVSDTGIGMKDETKNKLFKINEKISILGTEDERGTGLGLILCKEFVGKHGGEIWVESELGKGSNFKFTIPVFVE